MVSAAPEAQLDAARFQEHDVVVDDVELVVSGDSHRGGARIFYPERQRISRAEGRARQAGAVPTWPWGYRGYRGQCGHYNTALRPAPGSGSRVPSPPQSALPPVPTAANSNTRLVSVAARPGRQ